MMCLNRRVSIEGQPHGSLDRCLMPSKAPGSGKQQGNRGGGLDRELGRTPPQPPGDQAAGTAALIPSHGPLGFSGLSVPLGHLAGPACT